MGDIVNHRYEISNYKTKERVSIPAEKHIIVADRHEAIVSREDFERVQQLIWNAVEMRSQMRIISDT